MRSIQKENILELLGRPGVKPLKLNEILQKLDLGGHKKSELKRAVRLLHQEGKIKRLRGGRITLRKANIAKPKEPKPSQKATLIGKVQKRKNK